MGRKRRSHQTPFQDLERDLRPPRSLTRALSPVLAKPPHLGLIEDRRTYHPLGFFRPAKQTHGGAVGPVTVKTPPNKSRPFLAHGLGFSAPKKTLICVRRQQRKEVLFAKNRVGRGSTGRGRKRRNWYSNIGC